MNGPAVAPLEATDAQVFQAILGEDFMSFVEYSFSIVAPGKEFRPNWHLRAVAHKLTQVARGDVRRLIITMPPRNLKSICASVALPAWVLGHDPTERVVCVSYSDSLSKMHHNDFRALVTDPLYQATVPDMRIDPRKTVLVMQRVDADDLAGYLQEQGGYEILNLPAIALEDACFDLDHGSTYHRKEGEVLHPDHEPRAVLDEIKREMGPLSFSAQYQQAPIPPGGVIIKREWIREAPRPASDGRSEDLIVSWDIALSEFETGDYSACAVLLKSGDKYHVLDMMRG